MQQPKNSELMTIFFPQQAACLEMRRNFIMKEDCVWKQEKHKFKNARRAGKGGDASQAGILCQ